MAMMASPNPPTSSPQEPVLGDEDLFSNETEYTYNLSLHDSRSLKVKDFYGTFRRIALNQKILHITSYKSVDLLRAIIPLFHLIRGNECNQNIQDAIEDIEIRMIGSDNVAIRSRCGAIVQLMSMATNLLKNPQESTAGSRDWLWFIEKGAIFSTVANRVARECRRIFSTPFTLSLLWLDENDLTLKPEFADQNIFSDSVWMVAGITIGAIIQEEDVNRRGKKSRDHGEELPDIGLKYKVKDQYRKEISKCIVPILESDVISAAGDTVEAWIAQHKALKQGKNLGCCAETVPFLGIFPGMDHTSEGRQLFTCAFGVAGVYEEKPLDLSPLSDAEYRKFVLDLYRTTSKEPCNSCRKVFKDSKQLFRTIKTELGPDGNIVLVDMPVAQPLLL
ncbi:hypothetical protein M407DRAFT_32567 [Tulasnella calospora MUT 4182]|uniref:Uncharacterized protein n=1 Tax=Tulasnella calospora MUT 4182 TaxID=1051891 RepID=A0A0C3PSP8_9AGAM|nr:hypothetical protein M407DRAFT_32567 [Tulasnella calospora MUT 4182]